MNLILLALFDCVEKEKGLGNLLHHFEDITERVGEIQCYSSCGCR